MKARIKKMARIMANWPIAGRLVRIAIAVIRLPEFQDRYLEFSPQHLAIDSDRDNLVKSVPVALRKITRDLKEIEERLENNVKGVEKQLEGAAEPIEYLLGRVEFVRRELMFEMRYGASAPISDSDQLKTKTEVLSPEKLAAARHERLRLNLGCGHIPMEGYLNVDRRALPGVDIVAEVDALPFESGELDEIFSAHLLEHFPQEQLHRELLPYWIKLLKPGGEFRAVVPDADSMIKAYVKGDYPYAHLREVTFGAQDYDGDFHFNMFVPTQLQDLLTEAGLSNFELIAQGRKNGACFEMEIRGYKNQSV
jgi:SAM-dependent methyltransferase